MSDQTNPTNNPVSTTDDVTSETVQPIVNEGGVVVDAPTEPVTVDADADENDEETVELTPAEAGTETPAAEAAPTPVIEVVRTPRVFVVGSTRITENDSTVNLTADQVKDVLKAQFPEVANATVRERTEGDTAIVEFLPQPGRKG